MTIGRKLVGDLSATLTGRLLIADAKPSERLPGTPVSVTGNNSSMTALAIEPGLVYDSRDNPFRPTRGWFAEGVFTYTDQVDRDQFRYLGYRLEVQRYIPVFRGNRVLLLRAYLAKQDSVGGGTIPFYELNLLDLNNGLRGFDRGRWQDKGAILFNIQWRFPIWQDVEGDLFSTRDRCSATTKISNSNCFAIPAAPGSDSCPTGSSDFDSKSRRVKTAC